MTEKAEKLKEFIEIDKFSGHRYAITNVIVLSDGNICSSSIDGRIKIFNKDTYKIETMIDIFEFIFYHIELSNNCIAACCGSDSENLLRILVLAIDFMI